MHSQGSHFQLQYIGKRSVQQDCCSILVKGDCTVLILSDGMGGHSRGEKASELIVEHCLDYFKNRASLNDMTLNDLVAVVAGANQRIKEYVCEHSEFAGMGATLVCALISHDFVRWVSVGDSHLYRVDSSFRFEKLNEDHSMLPLLKQMADDGILEESSLSTHPMRNTLRSAIVGSQIDMIDKKEIVLDQLRDQLAFVVCSDGVDSLPMSEMRACFQTANESMEVFCQMVIDKLIEADIPSQDNASIMAVCA